MRHVLSVFAVLAFLTTVAMPAPAAAQAYSGTAGVDSTGASAPLPQITPPSQLPAAAQPAPMGTAPATLPPVFQGAEAADAATVPPALPTMPTAPVAPAATTPTTVPTTTAPAGLDAAKLPPDPCAAYINSYDTYAICQDRIQRLQRMQDARTKRLDAAAAARQREAERRAAQNAPKPETPKLRRPGQVPPPEKPPVQVQVVPAEPDAATGTGTTQPATVPRR